MALTLRIIGTKVVSQAGDGLGTVQDLILSLDSGRAPFAVVRYGGDASLDGRKPHIPHQRGARKGKKSIPRPGNS